MLMNFQTKCLTAFFPEEALEVAKSLDAYLKTTGKVIGPLHGLPVSIKVTELFDYPISVP